MSKLPIQKQIMLTAKKMIKEVENNMEGVGMGQNDRMVKVTRQLSLYFVEVEVILLLIAIAKPRGQPMLP